MAAHWRSGANSLIEKIGCRVTAPFLADLSDRLQGDIEGRLKPADRRIVQSPGRPRIRRSLETGTSRSGAPVTNLPLALPALYAFICGRGAQEKTIAELKGEFALEVVPTRHDGANSAWQQLSILAHNVLRSFQLETLATPKPRSRKRTYPYLLRSMRTLRFLLIARAGRLTRIDGRNVLRLTNNPATESLYDAVAHRLAA